MNNKEFLAELGRTLGYNQRDITRITNAMIEEIAHQLEEENTLAILGLGTFEVKKKLERVLVNPSTRQRMLVPPKMSVSFKCASILKEKLNPKA